MRTLALLASSALLAASLGGCTPHRTDATEVGVKFNKLTGSLGQYAPGATYFLMPVVNDWKVYDVSLRNLVMASDSRGGRGEKDDLRFKTRDGNDIETDVTVRWRIDPSRAALIWQSVAPDTASLKERIVRPQARTYVRDVLNRLDSEEYYNPDLRFAAATDATKV